jgi:Tol biopolymer transport system component
MPWPALAAAWIAGAWLAAHRHPEAPCEATAVHVARQHLAGDAAMEPTVDVSADGRLVTFVSLDRLAPGDTNALPDVYTLDRETGRVVLESTTAAGASADGSNHEPRVSGDGQVVVFASTAANLVGSVNTFGSQVMRRDRVTGAVSLVSRALGGGPGNGWSGHPDVSDDGRYVVFESRATDLVAGPDANLGGSDIYLYDAGAATMRRISLTDGGVQSASGQSWTPAIDGRGGVVAFTSTAPLDAPARARPDDPQRSVFVRELAPARTRWVSATRGGGVPDGASYSPAVSGDGRLTAFVSTAGDLAGAERRSRRPQLFVHDGGSSRLRLASRNAGGSEADGTVRHPVISADGRFVVFTTDASDLTCAGRCGSVPDRNLVVDVYRIDLTSGVADRVSGAGANAWWTASHGAAVDAAGHVIAFSSRQPVDESDLESDDDLFVAVLPGTAADGDHRVRAVPCGTAPSSRTAPAVP